MKRLRNILTVILLALGMLLPATVRAENTVDVKEIVFGHIGDSYEWHITTWGETHVTISLPVIVHSSTTGWHAFLSSRLEENGGSYEGFSIAPAGSKYEGKLVEYDATGNEIRPVGHLHHEGDTGFAHQQRIAASHHFECGALVSQAPAGKCRSRWFHRVYGDVYHDGER